MKCSEVPRNDSSLDMELLAVNSNDRWQIKIYFYSTGRKGQGEGRRLTNVLGRNYTILRTRILRQTTKCGVRQKWRNGNVYLTHQGTVNGDKWEIRK